MLKTLTQWALRPLDQSVRKPVYQRQYIDSEGRTRYSWPVTAKPAAPRHWHDITQPEQAARFEAAEAKRARRAGKLAVNTSRATHYNRAHTGRFDSSLNPFYIAK